jgi:NADH-quinone oxidoreductase subunit C
VTEPGQSSVGQPPAAWSWPDRVRVALASSSPDGVVVEEGFGPLAVDVPVASWVESVELARSALGCTFFDWLSAVDELGDGFRVVCHLAAPRPGAVDHLLLRTVVPRDAPAVPSIAEVFAGARWHERETAEMFGIKFVRDGSVLALEPLLLPDGFEGHPLRKDFVLASRVAKPWPGAKEPGESEAGAGHGAAPARRRTRPPGVPEPEQWGPRPPGSERPDPLAAAAAVPAARPRRTRPAPPGGTAAPRDAPSPPPEPGGEEPSA